MTDGVDRFFADLGQTSAGRLSPALTGTIRFTITRRTGNSSWLVTYAGGGADATAVPEGINADCVVGTTVETFERLLAGADHVHSLAFQNQLAISGDLPLLLEFRRLLPPRADSRGTPAPVRGDVRAVPDAGQEKPTGVVSVFYGNLLMNSDRKGDVEPSWSVPLGLFLFDTRFLSTWRLTVNGQRLQTLSIDDLQTYESRFFLTPGEPTHYVDTDVSVFRHRQVSDTFEERISLHNHAKHPMDLTVRLDVAADFADLLEIRNGTPRLRDTTATVRDGALHLRYQRERYGSGSVVTSSQPAEVDDGGMTFRARVEPHSTWSTDLRVSPLLAGQDDQDARDALGTYVAPTSSQAGQDAASWGRGAPRLHTDHEPLGQAYLRGVVDLSALRFRGLNLPEELPMAGVPWVMTFASRDAAISCLQALPVLPGLTPAALMTMAMIQGARDDPFRGEEPGKIVQDVRYGESAAFNELPEAARYGAADTTPLFLILLDEYERWTGDRDLVVRLRFEAQAALDWIDRYADLVGNGYLWYGARPTSNGPTNQSWRESPTGVSFRDGRLPGFPQATCEIQGYVYDAKRRIARIARQIWGDPALADRLERQAAELRERFNRDFWIPDRGYYAHAIQADGAQVDALTSNIGHLLWSGIVEPDRAENIVGHLMSPEMFNGWGIRTLATVNARYNPVGYHTGTVWPFDNSIIAWGLRRYGYRIEAARLAKSMLDAAAYFAGQLPEALAGYPASLTRYPVRYSSACVPYSTSAGAPMLFLRTLLGLEPYDDHLVIDPAVPVEMGHIELHDIPGRWGHADALGRGQHDLDGRKSQASDLDGADWQTMASGGDR